MTRSCKGSHEQQNSPFCLIATNTRLENQIDGDGNWKLNGSKILLMCSQSRVAQKKKITKMEITVPQGDEACYSRQVWAILFTNSPSQYVMHSCNSKYGARRLISKLKAIDVQFNIFLKKFYRTYLFKNRHFSNTYLFIIWKGNEKRIVWHAARTGGELLYPPYL